MKTNIEKFIEDSAKNIADVIDLKYGPCPSITVEYKSIFMSCLDQFFSGGISNMKAEKDIYTRSLLKAEDFFLENKEAKSDEELLKEIKLMFRARVKERDSKKSDERLVPEELLGNVIKFYTIQRLWDNGSNIDL